MRLVKTAARDVDAVGALELQRVRGDLHRARDVARVEHLAERALEVEGLGRRAHDLVLDAADHRLDRPEQPARQARALEQRAREERRRRLAVGAGDARHAQRRGRVAVEAGGRDGHRGAHVVDHDLGHAEPQRPLHDERRRAARDRVRREVVAVTGEAGDAEEQGPLSDEPVVEGQARDDHFGAVPEQLAERHATGSLRARPAARMLSHARRHRSGPPRAPHADRRRRRAVRALHPRRARRPRGRRPARARGAGRARAAGVLAELRGMRVAGPEALGRALVAAGGAPARHAHVYSHDLRERPRRVTAGLRADAGRSARAPTCCPSTWPRIRPGTSTGDRRRGQPRAPAGMLAGELGPLLDCSGLALARRAGRRRDPGRPSPTPTPPFGGPWVMELFRAPGARGAGRALLQRALAPHRGPRSASPSRTATPPSASTPRSASSACYTAFSVDLSARATIAAPSTPDGSVP